MATKYTIVVRQNFKVEEEEEVCSGGWEEAICCGSSVAAIRVKSMEKKEIEF
jgi:hypothetical protein